ncbi:MAG: hypothetical protein AB7H90_02625 [Alphaproteobacteria bacterium]
MSITLGTKLNLASFLLFFLGMTYTAEASIFSALDDFSIASNPNGPWSYGSTPGPVPGGPFSLNPFVGGADCNNPDLQGWQNSGIFPYVLKNFSAVSTSCPGTVTVFPDVLHLHPASDGKYSVVRWTAPLAGVYEISGFFEGLDFVGPTTTDAHVLVNGVSIVNIPISTFHIRFGFDFITTLNADDTVDFAVGFGNGNYFNDSTGLSATIATVSEPGIVSVLTTGLVLVFGAFRWCRRRNDLLRTDRCANADSVMVGWAEPWRSPCCPATT